MPLPSTVALAVFALFLIPNAWLVLSGTQQERTQEVLIFSANLENERGAQLLRERESSGWAHFVAGSPALCRVFVFGYNYLSYLGPDFLFFSGDPNLRHGTKGSGLYLRCLLPLVLTGLFALWRRRKEPEVRFILAWLLLFPVAASMTVSSPHAIRALTAIPVIEVVAATGLLSLGSWARLLKDAAWRPYWPPWLAAVVCGGVILMIPVEFGTYLRHYHRKYPDYAARAWQAGLDKAILDIERRKEEYHRIYVSSKIYNPYLYVLFYADPKPSLIGHSEDLNQRLRPLRYELADGPQVPALGARDVFLVPAEDRPLYPYLALSREYVYPTGDPCLYLLKRRLP